ncbi:MAG TPA: cupredoxin domain-containing protein [Gammaproteobacteria bacterium]|jgi:plastocyanin domain-containing protein|nr:cupredoxin domain-containing protein [Gammaproteobacteria bacterium]
MNATQIIVNVSGLAIIAWIVWYFWLWRGESFAAQTKNGIQTVDVVVKGGYQPAAIMVKAGQRVRLNFTRREASTCSEEVVIPDFGKRAFLPENLSVPIEVMPEKPGEYAFTCGMNMYRGKLIAE